VMKVSWLDRWLMRSITGKLISATIVGIIHI
jgi:hypothetical protein